MLPSVATLAIVILALCGALSALLPAPIPLRAVLTVPLAVLLPGLAIQRMRPFAGADGLAGLALGVPLSLAICVLAGLALNAAGALEARDWAVTLCAVTVAAALLRREPGAPERARFEIGVAQAFVGLATLALFAAGVAVARSGALAHRQFAYTEFWMTPRAPAEQNIVTLGVRNAEREDTSYSLAIVAGGAVIGRWPPVRLAPGETWTHAISLNSELRRSPRVEAWLYRTDAPQIVYRKAWISAPHARQKTD